MTLSGDAIACCTASAIGRRVGPWGKATQMTQMPADDTDRVGQIILIYVICGYLRSLRPLTAAVRCRAIRQPATPCSRHPVIPLPAPRRTCPGGHLAGQRSDGFVSLCPRPTSTSGRQPMSRICVVLVTVSCVASHLWAAPFQCDAAFAARRGIPCYRPSRARGRRSSRAPARSRHTWIASISSTATP